MKIQSTTNAGPMFLPDNYEAPRASDNYMKFQEGENKFRILSAPILGWEDWLDKKPVRFRFEEKPTKPIDSTKPIKHFWAFVVWNYSEKKIQILQITQATLRSKIEALSKDEEWGAPYFYDLKVWKKGEGVKTEYEVNPVPHRTVTKEIIAAYEAKPCNLEALFDSSDPFDHSWSVHTPGIFSDAVEPKKESDDDVKLKLHNFLEQFVQGDKPEVSRYLEKYCQAYKTTMSKAIDEFSAKDKSVILDDIAKWKAKQATKTA